VVFALSRVLVGGGVGVIEVGVAVTAARSVVAAGGGVDVLVGAGVGVQAIVRKKIVAISAAIEGTALESILSAIVPVCLLWRG
jgi:hypothetical protein